MRARPRATIGGLVLALAACGSPVQESLTTAIAGDDSSTSNDPTATSLSATTSNVSESDDGNSVGEGSENAEATEDTADTDPGTTGTVESEDGSDHVGSSDGTDEGATTTETTDEPVDCAPLDGDACEAASDDCMSLVGTPLVHLNGPFWCIAEEEFLGCAPIGDCDAAVTVACEGRNSAWLFPSTCLPSGWAGCPAPGNGDYAPCDMGDT